MFSAILRRLVPAAVVSAGLLCGAPYRVQAQAAKAKRQPEITKLTIKGVKSVDKGDLLQNLSVDESHCNSMVLEPLCLISKSPLFYTRVYLDTAELGRDVFRARVYYFERGFRDTQVDTSIAKAGRNAVHVTLTVHEGPPTLVSAVDVHETKPVLSQKEIAQRLSLKKGQPLNLFKLDSTRLNLDNRLWDRGYSDAIIDTSITTDTTAHAAAIAFNIDPRWQSRVASVDVQGNKKVSARTIKKSLSFKAGDVYRQSDVLESQRTLYSSNLFRRAAIEVPPTDDSLKHVVVAVTEAPPHSARWGLGVNTIDFVQAQGHYVDYDWLGGAKQLTLDATLSNLFAQQLNGNGIFYNVGRTVVGGSQAQYLAPTYTLSADVRYPWFGSPSNSIDAGVFAHRRSAPGIYVDRGYGLSASFTRLLTTRGPASLTYRYEVTHTDAGDVYFCVNYGVCDAPTLSALRNSERLSPIALTVNLDKTDDPYEPRRGYRTQLDLEHASALTLSDFRYNRASGDMAMFLPIGRKSVLGGHIQLGWVNALSSTSEALGLDSLGHEAAVINPRKRFYAGGANSVRGFAESQLGPRVLTVPASKLLADDPSCTVATLARCNPNLPAFQDRDFTPRPLGGNRLIEANVEYRFPLFGNFLGATFVDGAYLGQNIAPNLPRSKTAVTPGFGVRYLSEAGPIRVDIGINPEKAEKLPVVTEDVANGGNGLITLNQSRTYDPAKGSGGINSLLARLTLHLSIGEAF